ncbi:MAG TPA: HEAT repeat domain-containing protein [Candidatus Acidoferrum sp.]|nr:HEAT repeat domain-containing protein [Candidatus Acidoferrum sp.]
MSETCIPERFAGWQAKWVRWKVVGRYALAMSALAGFSLLAGFETARISVSGRASQAAAPESQPNTALSQARASTTPDTSGAELARLAPQDQAERLLERAIQDDDTALDDLHARVDGWRGNLKNTDDLFNLVLEALNSKNLRVRTAAVEVDLAANNLSKSPESVTKLIQQLQSDPTTRGMSLWRLGSLGNRGVQPERVLTTLLHYTQSPSEHTRYWAVEGLAMLGNDATLDPLLDLLAHDPSPKVRERAASSLGQSGLLTREERLAAVPNLLNLADDDSLSLSTRQLVYGALRVITGAPLGNDANSWRAWWAGHDPARKQTRESKGQLFA